MYATGQERTPTERAQETGLAERSLGRAADAFDTHGIVSLFRPGHPRSARITTVLFPSPCDNSSLISKPSMHSHYCRTVADLPMVGKKSVSWCKYAHAFEMCPIVCERSSWSV